jgi:hypothetical protein
MNYKEQIWMPATLHTQLQKLAQAEHRTMSQLVTLLCIAGMKTMNAGEESKN